MTSLKKRLSQKKKKSKPLFSCVENLNPLQKCQHSILIILGEIDSIMMQY